MSRVELKQEICDYLISQKVSRDLLPKCIQKIKDAAYQSCSLDSEMLMDRKTKDYVEAIGLSEGDEFYYKLSWNFAPRHYLTLVGFVNRLEAIIEAEAEAELSLESAIQEEIRRQFDPLGDSEYDELGCPDFAICAYSEHVEVRAFEPGVGDILPKKGRKYIGCRDDIRWRFPLDMLSELEKTGRPLVRVADLQQ